MPKHNHDMAGTGVPHATSILDHFLIAHSPRVEPFQPGDVYRVVADAALRDDAFWDSLPDAKAASAESARIMPAGELLELEPL